MISRFRVAVVRPVPRILSPKADATGAAGLALAVSLALVGVAHCQYFAPPPTRQFWFVLWAAAAALLRSPCRAFAGWVRRTPGRSAVLPAAAGLVLAVWWQGRVEDTLWLHSPSARPILAVLLFTAHVVTGAAAAAGCLGVVAATDPAPRPISLTSARASSRWSAVAALLLFLAAANAFAAWYVGRERALYYCDYMAYWSWTVDWVGVCSRSPADGWERFRVSVQSPGYGLLPAVAPGAAVAVLGDHRLVFVLAVVNGYLGATVAAAILFVRRQAGSAGWPAAAVPVALLGTMPLAWAPVLRGYLDVGGVALAILALAVYLRRPREELRWPDLLAVAALLTALALFRRWYGFWVVAFLAVAGVEAGAAGLWALARRRWADAWRAVRPVAAVGGLAAALVVGLALPMVVQVARADYADSYAAYRSKGELPERVWAALRDVGLGYVFAAAAATLFLACRRPTRRAALFVAATAPLIVLHFLRVQDFNIHHLYLLLPAVLLPTATAAAVLLGRLPAWAGAVGVLGLAAAGAVALAAVVDDRAAWVRPHLGPLPPRIDARPLTRPDLDEFRRLVRFLRDETDRTGERFAVVSSSATLHPSMLVAAGWSLREPFPGAARMEPAGDVDRVDGFPAGVFRAGLLVVADPPQAHLDPAEQQTVLVPARQVLAGTGIGKAFDRLPAEFALQNGVTVRVYRRARPVAPEDLAAFAEELRRAHPGLPHVFTPPADVAAGSSRLLPR